MHASRVDARRAIGYAGRPRIIHQVSVMRAKASRKVEVFLAIFCLGFLTSFPIATTTVRGMPQEGNDAAAANAKGLELFQSGKFEEAVGAYKQAIKQKPDYSEAYYNLGDAYFQLSLYKEAIDAYKRAVKYQADFAPTHNNMGTAYFKLGEHKKAIDAYKEAIRLDPKTSVTYYNLAATYLVRGNKKAALVQHKILQSLDPPLADKLYILIYQPMATVFDGVVTRLSVIAADSQGFPVHDLEQQDFQVFEDGVPQTISSFSKAQVPLVYALAIDTSGSMRNTLDLAVRTGMAIIQTNAPKDETLLVRFVSSDKIETVQEFTSDETALKKGLDTFYVEGGQSAILDAVYLAAEGVAKRKFTNSPRRALILVTDGDERASYYTVEELLKLLRKIDVQLFAISLDKDDRKGATLNQDPLKRSVDLLTKLARETGGQAFFPKSLAELQVAITQMMDSIRTEYVIAYKPTNSEAGRYRRVTVNIVEKPGREKWSVVTRAGYVVPEK
jgi:Ca-activated chloride channel family protein